MHCPSEAVSAVQLGYAKKLARIEEELSGEVVQCVGYGMKEDNTENRSSFVELSIPLFL